MENKKEKKLDCAIKLIKDQLVKEKKNLETYQRYAENKDFFTARIGAGNIESCKTRVQHLQTAFDLLDNYRIV